MRCPHCGSLETKRNGHATAAPTGLKRSGRPLQRFSCGACGKTFTLGRRSAGPRARFADDVMVEAVRLYVESLASYRSLARLLSDRLGRTMTPMTINRWVHELGAQAMTPLEVSAALAPPGWGGFLGIDGKVIWVDGEKQVLMIGVDHPSQDVVHAVVVPDETGEAMYQLVRDAVVEASYPLQGLVIDLARGFVEAHRNYLPALPLQVCRVHFDRRLDSDVPRVRHSERAPLHAELRERVRAVLYASSYEEACELMWALNSDRARYTGAARVRPQRHHDVISSLAQKFNLYMTHHFVPGLPADNNVTENVIKQLGKKLRLMEGFATPESAETFVRLLVACYRFKPFTSSCRPHNNGLSPLELAGAVLPPEGWLRYLLRGPQEQH